MDFEILKVRKAHGPMKLRREREEYFRLVREGYSNKEASGLVGVNERTGREWRNGRTDPNRFRAPAQSERAPGPASSGRYLRGDARIHIAERLREKATIRSIAAELSRSPSTVSREIRRNRTMDPRGLWHYRPHAAQARADARRPRPKAGKIATNIELRDVTAASGPSVEPGTDLQRSAWHKRS